MSEARKVVLEGGDYNGVEYDLRGEAWDVFKDKFELKINGVPYRTTGEFKDDREIMVYDG